MRSLGSPIVYRVPEDRHTQTQKHDKSEVTGSAYHPEQTEFAGMIVAVKEGGKFDVMIFPPNRTPTTINDLPEDQLEDPGTAHMTRKPTQEDAAPKAPASKFDDDDEKPHGKRR